MASLWPNILIEAGALREIDGLNVGLVERFLVHMLANDADPHSVQRLLFREAAIGLCGQPTRPGNSIRRNRSNAAEASAPLNVGWSIHNLLARPWEPMKDRAREGSTSAASG